MGSSDLTESPPRFLKIWRASVEVYINATGEFSVCMYVCMYVCLRPLSMYVCQRPPSVYVCMSQAAKRVCMYVCMPQTYIHTYWEFARRINIALNWCAPHGIEVPKRSRKKKVQTEGVEICTNEPAYFYYKNISVLDDASNTCGCIKGRLVIL